MTAPTPAADTETAGSGMMALSSAAAGFALPAELPFPPGGEAVVLAVVAVVAWCWWRRLVPVAVLSAALAASFGLVPGFGPRPGGPPAPAAATAAGALPDAAIAEVARSSGLAGCRGIPAGTWVAVALAESGGNTHARNPNGEDSRGLWQINMRAHAGWVGGRDLYDPAVNAWAARTVCERQGIGAWGAYTNGSYRRFLTRGHAVAADGPPPVPAGYHASFGHVQAAGGMPAATSPRAYATNIEKQAAASAPAPPGVPS